MCPLAHRAQWGTELEAASGTWGFGGSGELSWCRDHGDTAWSLPGWSWLRRAAARPYPGAPGTGEQVGACLLLKGSSTSHGIARAGGGAHVHQQPPPGFRKCCLLISESERCACCTAGHRARRDKSCSGAFRLQLCELLGPSPPGMSCAGQTVPSPFLASRQPSSEPLLPRGREPPQLLLWQVHLPRGQLAGEILLLQAQGEARAFSPPRPGEARACCCSGMRRSKEAAEGRAEGGHCCPLRGPRDGEQQLGGRGWALKCPLHPSPPLLPSWAVPRGSFPPAGGGSAEAQK